MSERVEADVLIVGGGLVGSLAARALLEIPLRVALVEAREAWRLEQPSFDGRSTALANGSQRVLEQLGIWAALGGSAQPIESIHIGERGRFGAACIEAREERVRALGFTVENRVLGEALWTPLAEAAGFECFAPATLERFESRGDRVVAAVTAGGRRVEVEARLLIAADGTRSSVRRALGISAREDDYEQQAVIVNCTTEVPHSGRAFERFTTDGPLAVLPLGRGRVAVVWSLQRDAALEAMALADDAFRDALQTAFGYRLGRIERVGARVLHELKRVRSESLTQARSVLVGSAAVSLHPVAGQGFNLAVRDVATLAEVVADEHACGESADIGAEHVLGRYREWRIGDQRKVATFTHGLVRCFGADLPGLGFARGLGLAAFDLFPGAKGWLARHTMGRAGRLPRLARGLDLN